MQQILGLILAIILFNLLKNGDNQQEIIFFYHPCICPPTNHPLLQYGPQNVKQQQDISAHFGHTKSELNLNETEFNNLLSELYFMLWSAGRIFERRQFRFCVQDRSFQILPRMPSVCLATAPQNMPIFVPSISICINLSQTVPIASHVLSTQLARKHQYTSYTEIRLLSWKNPLIKHTELKFTV